MGLALGEGHPPNRLSPHLSQAGESKSLNRHSHQVVTRKTTVKTQSPTGVRCWNYNPRDNQGGPTRGPAPVFLSAFPLQLSCALLFKLSFVIWQNKTKEGLAVHA